MLSTISLSNHLGLWMRWVCAHPLATIAGWSLVTLAALYVALTGLGIDTDTIELFPEDLPARQSHAAFTEVFPDLENALLIVIDGATA